MAVATAVPQPGSMQLGASSAAFQAPAASPSRLSPRQTAPVQSPRLSSRNSLKARANGPGLSSPRASPAASPGANSRQLGTAGMMRPRGAVAVQPPPRVNAELRSPAASPQPLRSPAASASPPPGMRSPAASPRTLPAATPRSPSASPSASPAPPHQLLVGPSRSLGSGVLSASQPHGSPRSNPPNGGTALGMSASGPIASPKAAASARPPSPSPRSGAPGPGRYAAGTPARSTSPRSGSPGPSRYPTEGANSPCTVKQSPPSPARSSLPAGWAPSSPQGSPARTLPPGAIAGRATISGSPRSSPTRSMQHGTVLGLGMSGLSPRGSPRGSPTRSMQSGAASELNTTVALPLPDGLTAPAAAPVSSPRIGAPGPPRSARQGSPRDAAGSALPEVAMPAPSRSGAPAINSARAAGPARMNESFYTAESLHQLPLDENGQPLARGAPAEADAGNPSTIPRMPLWMLRDDTEKPAGTRDMGGWTASVYTVEQQQRLGVDERGVLVYTVEQQQRLGVDERGTPLQEALFYTSAAATKIDDNDGGHVANGILTENQQMQDKSSEKAETVIEDAKPEEEVLQEEENVQAQGLAAPERLVQKLVIPLENPFEASVPVPQMPPLTSVEYREPVDREPPEELSDESPTKFSLSEYVLQELQENPFELIPCTYDAANAVLSAKVRDRSVDKSFSPGPALLKALHKESTQALGRLVRSVHNSPSLKVGGVNLTNGQSSPLSTPRSPTAMWHPKLPSRKSSKKQRSRKTPSQILQRLPEDMPPPESPQGLDSDALDRQSPDQQLSHRSLADLSQSRESLSSFRSTDQSLQLSTEEPGQPPPSSTPLSQTLEDVGLELQPSALQQPAPQPPPQLASKSFRTSAMEAALKEELSLVVPPLQGAQLDEFGAQAAQPASLQAPKSPSANALPDTFLKEANKWHRSMEQATVAQMLQGASQEPIALDAASNRCPSEQSSVVIAPPSSRSHRSAERRVSGALSSLGTLDVTVSAANQLSALQGDATPSTLHNTEESLPRGLDLHDANPVNLVLDAEIANIGSALGSAETPPVAEVAVAVAGSSRQMSQAASQASIAGAALPVQAAILANSLVGSQDASLASLRGPPLSLNTSHAASLASLRKNGSRAASQSASVASLRGAPQSQSASLAAPAASSASQVASQIASQVASQAASVASVRSGAPQVASLNASVASLRSGAPQGQSHAASVASLRSGAQQVPSQVASVASLRSGGATQMVNVEPFMGSAASQPAWIEEPDETIIAGALIATADMAPPAAAAGSTREPIGLPAALSQVPQGDAPVAPASIGTLASMAAPLPSPSAADHELYVGAQTVAGHKQHFPGWINQDAHFVATLGPNKLCVGVFDGHGIHGHHISNGVRDLFAQVAPTLPGPSDPKLPEAFHRLFAYADEATVATGLAEWSGTTATVAIVDMDARAAAVAHVGDSRLLIASGPHVHFETVDHTVDAVAESRVTASGGEVRLSTISGVTARRVFLAGTDVPGLAMSRAIGDTQARSVGVIPEPTITTGLDFVPGSVLVVATDGVWEKMPSGSVAAIAVHAEAEAAANELTQAARSCWAAEGNDIDDITAVVMRAGRLSAIL